MSNAKNLGNNFYDTTEDEASEPLLCRIFISLEIKMKNNLNNLTIF